MLYNIFTTNVVYYYVNMLLDQVTVALNIYLDVKVGKWHNSTKVVPADVSLNMNGKKVGRIPALCSISAVELEQAHWNRGGHGATGTPKFCPILLE